MASGDDLSLHRAKRHRVGFPLCRGVLLLPVAIAFGTAQPDDQEWTDALMAHGFPDLAQIVLERFGQAFSREAGDACDRAFRILLARGDLMAAEQELIQRTDAGGLWMLLAERAQSEGDEKLARSAYARFFEGTVVMDESTLRAALRYGVLLDDSGELERAVTLYETILAVARSHADPGERADEIARMTRPIMLKLAELLLEKEERGPEHVSRAQRLCEEVQLGGVDLWFGKAVVLWCHGLRETGAWKEMQTVLESNLELLLTIEQSLEKEGAARVSPLAGARFFLGSAYLQAGRTADALHQFLNTAARYPDSRWGPLAQAEADSLIGQLEAEGNIVQIAWGSHPNPLERNRLRNAQRMVEEQRFEEAVPALLEVLNRTPEGEGTIDALRDLLRCLIQLKDPLQSLAVASYLAERFQTEEGSSRAILLAAREALDQKQECLAFELYEIYLQRFPGDTRAPSILLTLATLRRQSGDLAGEEALLSRLIDTMPDAPQTVQAMERNSWNAFGRNDFGVAIPRFEALLERQSDPERRLAARFALAESHRLGTPAQPEEAFMQYHMLEEEIRQLDRAYGAPDALREAARDHLESAVFYQGLCLVQAGRKAEAVEELSRFAEQFPSSQRLARSQLLLGMIFLELKRPEESLAALKMIREEQGPDLYETALFQRGHALMALGRAGEAAATWHLVGKRQPPSPYFFDALLLQGQALTVAGQEDEAIEILSELMRIAPDDLLLHRAGLALGRAQRDPVQKLASFQRVALLADASDPRQHELIAAALEESLPLYLDLARPSDALADVDRLLSEFSSWGTPSKLTALREMALAASGEGDGSP